MKVEVLAGYLENLENTPSRNKMTEILAELFEKSSEEEIDSTVNLILGQLAPGYEGIVFNIAERLMFQVLAKAYSEDIRKVKELYKNKGDLGDVAFTLSQKQKLKSKNQLNIGDVHKKLLEIAKEEGEGTQDKKIEQTARLLSKLGPLSAKYVARIPVGKLRLGFSDKTILDALSWMKNGDKSSKKDLDKAYNVYPNVGFIAKRVKEVGIGNTVKKIKPTVGAPILPVLAQRLKNPDAIIKKMGEAIVEPKYDGLRIQIHYSKKGMGEGKEKIKAFTRNLNETSWMFPELNYASKFIKANEVILDCEAIGIDEERKSMANFQKTMTRRRKHDIETISKKVAIRFFVFDLMYKDGKSFIDVPYFNRREILEKTLKGGKLFEIVKYEKTKDPQVIRDWMQKELKEGMEGIIVKKADSDYVSGRTGWRWVKMKEVESANSKLADSLDCVVMGYNAGRGKRSGFGIGGFLVGIRKGDKILTLTKIGTGLTDDQFRELKKRLIDMEVKEKPKDYGNVNKTLVPDVWTRPELVVEIEADEITNSPIHSSGFALRFPRLVKFRDDKSVYQATTLSEVKKLFDLQKNS